MGDRVTRFTGTSHSSASEHSEENVDGSARDCTARNTVRIQTHNSPRKSGVSPVRDSDPIGESGARLRESHGIDGNDLTETN